MLFETAEHDGPAREIDPSRRDLKKLGGPASGEVQRLAERPAPGGLAAGRGKEGSALLSVETEPVSSGVMEAHFGHVNGMPGKC